MTARDESDWDALADRMQALAVDLMAAVGEDAIGAGDFDNARELDDQAIRLWSLSLTHYAIQIRQMKGGG